MADERVTKELLLKSVKLFSEVKSHHDHKVFEKHEMLLGTTLEVMKKFCARYESLKKGKGYMLSHRTIGAILDITIQSVNINLRLIRGGKS